MMLNRAQILERLPQGEPFVFVDRAELCSGGISGEYAITGQECFSAGHFPNRPVFPASIMVEALGQLGIVYMMEHYRDEGIDPESIFFIKSEDVICRRKCGPGDVLRLEMKVIRAREPLLLFAGKISVSDELTMKVSSMSLSFSTQASEQNKSIRDE